MIFFIFNIVYRSIFLCVFSSSKLLYFQLFYTIVFDAIFASVYTCVFRCYFMFLFQEKKMGIIPIFLYGYFYGFSELIPSLARSSINKPLFSGYAPIVCFYMLKPCCFLDHKMVHSTYLVYTVIVPPQLFHELTLDVSTVVPSGSNNNNGFPILMDDSFAINVFPFSCFKIATASFSFMIFFLLFLSVFSFTPDGHLCPFIMYYKQVLCI